ncbi:MAG: alpha/beta fold hydrolase [Lachnospiraceae bacterium]|nr:alpha/beta fold hydrolase [Lachnospiraceae bacterium]
MIFNEYRYEHISGSDGLALSVLRIEPDLSRPIKGIVQLVHGMSEYKERYVDFMKYLAENGYITVIHDHRGHGESIKEKDDLGYLYEGGYEALIEDIHEITLETKEYVKEELGLNDRPYILLGHSMGSLAVRCYIKKYDDEIDKLCVLGCPSEQKGAKAGLKLIEAMIKAKGGKSLSKTADYLVMDSRLGKRFKAEGKGMWLNSDPDKVAQYIADPGCGFRFTLNGYENLIKLTLYTYEQGGYALNNPDLKIKFFSGKDDPCAISYKDLRNAMLLLKHSGYQNVSGKMYKGMRHEILNEPEHERVYKDILDFIQE